MIWSPQYVYKVWARLVHHKLVNQPWVQNSSLVSYFWPPLYLFTHSDPLVLWSASQVSTTPQQFWSMAGGPPVPKPFQAFHKLVFTNFLHQINCSDWNPSPLCPVAIRIRLLRQFARVEWKWSVWLRSPAVDWPIGESKEFWWFVRPHHSQSLDSSIHIRLHAFLSPICPPNSNNQIPYPPSICCRNLPGWLVKPRLICPVSKELSLLSRTSSVHLFGRYM